MHICFPWFTFAMELFVPHSCCDYIPWLHNYVRPKAASNHNHSKAQGRSNHAIYCKVTSILYVHFPSNVYIKTCFKVRYTLSFLKSYFLCRIPLHLEQTLSVTHSLIFMNAIICPPQCPPSETHQLQSMETLLLYWQLEFQITCQVITIWKLTTQETGFHLLFFFSSIMFLFVKSLCALRWLIEAVLRIYASVDYTIIGSDNGLSPGWCQAIIWSNTGI